MFPEFFVGVCILFSQNEISKAHNTVRSSKSILNASFNGFKITEKEISILLIENGLKCSSLCTEVSSCMSFAYNEITQTCVLFDSDFAEPSSTQKETEEGWNYSYVIKKSELGHTNCSGQNTPDICSLYCLRYINDPDSPSQGHLSDMCESFTGGELVKINRELKQFCVQKLIENEVYGEVLIQGIRDELHNVWKFNDGTEMTYFNWNTGANQPNLKPNEIYIGVRKTTGYVWHDLFDTDVHAAVCQQI